MKSGTCFSIASLLGISLCSLSCGPAAATNTTPPAPVCNQLTGYAASSMTTYSFATDIAPILSNAASCGLGTACHGAPSIFLDTAMTKQLTFTGNPATVKAALLGSSVNAPSMKIVVAGNVGASFLAYKVSSKIPEDGGTSQGEALSCVESKCTAHATTGTVTACGDPMPALGLGMLADADKTKILDWIAQGAKD